MKNEKELNNDELNHVSGGKSLADIEIEIAKLNKMIDTISKAINQANEACIKQIISVLQSQGDEAAIALTNELFANDEKTRKMILDIINNQ